jgi:hypothetical protein
MYICLCVCLCMLIQLNSGGYRTTWVVINKAAARDWCTQVLGIHIIIYEYTKCCTYTCMALSTSNAIARGIKNNPLLVHFYYKRVEVYYQRAKRFVRYLLQRISYFHCQLNTLIALYDSVAWVGLIFSRHKIYSKRSGSTVWDCHKTYV